MKRNKRNRTTSCEPVETAGLSLHLCLSESEFILQSGQEFTMDKVAECKVKCQLPAAICNYILSGRVPACARVCHDACFSHSSCSLNDKAKSLPGRLQHAANRCLDGIHWMSNQGIGGTIEDASAKSCTGLGRKATSQIFGCRAMNILCSNLK